LTSFPKTLILSEINWEVAEMKTLCLILVMGLSWPAFGQEAAKTDGKKDVGVVFQEGLTAFQAGKKSEAIAIYQQLFDQRWKDLNNKGKHGTATLLLGNLVFTGKRPEAEAYGAKLFQQAPGFFLSFEKLSGTPGEGDIGALRKALTYFAIQTMKGSSIIYLCNSSDKDVTISASGFDVVYGYKTNKVTIEKMSNKDVKPAFPVQPLELKAGKGRIIISRKSSGIGLLPFPDLITILASEDIKRTPDWIHLKAGGYSQTLTELQVRATVKWGDKDIPQALLVNMTAKP
jgi:hypothetical protein